jgi:hypothetical protein
MQTLRRACWLCSVDATERSTQAVRSRWSGPSWVWRAGTDITRLERMSAARHDPNMTSDAAEHGAVEVEVEVEP